MSRSATDLLLVFQLVAEHANDEFIWIQSLTLCSGFRSSDPDRAIESAHLITSGLEHDWDQKIAIWESRQRYTPQRVVLRDPLWWESDPANDSLFADPFENWQRWWSAGPLYNEPNQGDDSDSNLTETVSEDGSSSLIRYVPSSTEEGAMTISVTELSSPSPPPSEQCVLSSHEDLDPGTGEGSDYFEELSEGLAEDSDGGADRAPGR